MARTGAANSKLMWGAAVAAAAVVAMTLFAVFSGDEEDAPPAGKGGGTNTASPTGSPLPTYGPPEEWSEPDNWASLPRAKKKDARENDVGFPHSTKGALAALVAANSTDARGDRSLVEEQVDIYLSYMVGGEQNAANAQRVKDAAVKTEEKMRRSMGIKGESGTMPSGAYLRNHVVGYKVIHKSGDEVSAWLLTRVTAKAGEMEKEKGSYTRTISAVEWEDGDWKLSAHASVRAAGKAKGQERPRTAAPGDAAFNAAGWTALREAS